MNTDDSIKKLVKNNQIANLEAKLRNAKSELVLAKTKVNYLEKKLEKMRGENNE